MLHVCNMCLISRLSNLCLLRVREDTVLPRAGSIVGLRRRYPERSFCWNCRARALIAGSFPPGVELKVEREAGILRLPRFAIHVRVRRAGSGVPLLRMNLASKLPSQWYAYLLSGAFAKNPWLTQPGEKHPREKPAFPLGDYSLTSGVVRDSDKAFSRRHHCRLLFALLTFSCQGQRDHDFVPSHKGQVKESR